ncbi:MAG TPA: hypothetical protein VFU91_09230 [Sphingomicrobium sp.]|jgi:Ni/Co efflux regulator RcnB|nr:hypothetical protein [Sphingomicrobium sp.]
MRNLLIVSATALVLTPVASAPAFAQSQTQQQQQQQSGKKVPDPNEVVCEKQQDTGSRLAAHRVCMTRSQWAEQRRLDRQDVDKAQTQAPLNTPQ